VQADATVRDGRLLRPDEPIVVGGDRTVNGDDGIARITPVRDPIRVGRRDQDDRPYPGSGGGTRMAMK